MQVEYVGSSPSLHVLLPSNAKVSVRISLPQWRITSELTLHVVSHYSGHDISEAFLYLLQSLFFHHQLLTYSQSG